MPHDVSRDNGGIQTSSLLFAAFPEEGLSEQINILVAFSWDFLYCGKLNRVLRIKNHEGYRTVFFRNENFDCCCFQKRSNSAHITASRINVQGQWQPVCTSKRALFQLFTLLTFLLFSGLEQPSVSENVPSEVLTYSQPAREPNFSTWEISVYQWVKVYIKYRYLRRNSNLQPKSELSGEIKLRFYNQFGYHAVKMSRSVTGVLIERADFQHLSGRCFVRYRDLILVRCQSKESKMLTTDSWPASEQDSN